jgi:predicted GNAT family acetyltransferase
MIGGMSREITDNAGASRYEIRVDGKLAGFAEYRLRPENRIAFTHTEVDGAYEGQGVGSALARGALDDARARGLAVVPLCPFIKGWIDKHHDYADIVAG